MAPRAAPDDLRRAAAQAQIESAAFENCLASGKFAATVENDVAEGTAAGVTGTPAFFVNGRLISGAQPMEKFVQVIEAELAQRR
jgi:protein-disulfide isomerase